MKAAASKKVDSSSERRETPPPSDIGERGVGIGDAAYGRQVSRNNRPHAATPKRRFSRPPPNHKQVMDEVERRVRLEFASRTIRCRAARHSNAICMRATNGA